MNKHTREHQEYERARRESRLQAVKNDPEAMQRMGLDPEAFKKAIRTSILDAFQEADENQDGSLQWPEFYNAACKLLEEQGMEDQTDRMLPLAQTQSSAQPTLRSGPAPRLLLTRTPCAWQN